MVASYSCVVGCKDEFYMSIPSSDLTYRQVNVYFCTLAHSEFEAEDAVVTLLALLALHVCHSNYNITRRIARAFARLVLKIQKSACCCILT